jgi:hypothetical protein
MPGLRPLDVFVGHWGTGTLDDHRQTVDDDQQVDHDKQVDEQQADDDHQRTG